MEWEDCLFEIIDEHALGLTDRFAERPLGSKTALREEYRFNLSFGFRMTDDAAVCLASGNAFVGFD
jgi:hypothetical protein